MTKVIPPMKMTCESIVLNPREATKLSFFLTTRSTATPIKTSGAISNILFSAENKEAVKTFDFHTLIYFSNNLIGLDFFFINGRHS